eukprot:1602439-Prymnesium_polylepis.1
MAYGLVNKQCPHYCNLELRSHRSAAPFVSFCHKRKGPSASLGRDLQLYWSTPWIGYAVAVPARCRPDPSASSGSANFG